MKKILFLLSVVLLSCGSSEKQKPAEPSLSEKEYVYEDVCNGLHYDRKCYKITLSSINLSEGSELNTDNPTTAKILIGSDHLVHRIRIDELEERHLYYCCTECITDARYDSLKASIAKRKSLLP